MLELVNPCHQEAVVDVHAFQIADLRALNGELCKTCTTFHPTMTLNVHEASWLKSSHTSTAATVALDFCEFRGLHQLIHFLTQQDAKLDLILSEYMYRYCYTTTQFK